ncbi:MAG: hypothetical protein LUD02_06635 [Tannerellaceae bacterium]|nr:hypothetical protein [Tannerellaceae bacterium]MCD8263865.1 hypothetical protein [Tannerellaceae bacterium]
MKAIRVYNYGSTDALRHEEVPVPAFDKHQVLLKVEATSVNHLEVLMISGKNREICPFSFHGYPVSIVQA